MSRKAKATGKDPVGVKLTCNVCAAEITIPHAFDQHGARQEARKKGWAVNHRTQSDYCPLCVKNGYHESPEYNPPAA